MRPEIRLWHFDKGRQVKIITQDVLIQVRQSGKKVSTLRIFETKFRNFLLSFWDTHNLTWPCRRSFWFGTALLVGANPPLFAVISRRRLLKEVKGIFPLGTAVQQMK